MLLGIVFALPAHAAHRRTHQFPRTANLFLKWHLNEEEARALAHSWDVIILDMEVAEHSPRELALLRALNPKAKLLAYLTSQEVRRDLAVNPQAPMRQRLATRLHDAWYLRSTRGERLTWWPQTWLVNITDRAPVVGGQRWPDALAAFIAEDIAARSLWDGVYLDNLWGGISWFDRDTVDLDGDGQVEDPRTRDTHWRDGVRTILRTIRSRVPAGFLIIGNGSATYAAETNGLLLEHFPETSEGDWSRSIAAYRAILTRAAAPALAILNSNTGNTGVRENWRSFRFGLASTLLGDGYYSFDFGDRDHAQLWRYDEYDVHLGEPKGDARAIGAPPGASVDSAFPRGVYRRDFSQGLALVNATDTLQMVTFDEEFERLHGVQDPMTNDGRIVSELVLPPRDGTLLLRPLAGIDGAPFVNGAFARVFRQDGTVARTGFFAYDGRFRGGTTIERLDLDRDGTPEVVVGDRTSVRVFGFDGTERVRMDPFGAGFTGGVTFAVADLDRNGTQELIVAPRVNGGTIEVWDPIVGRRIRTGITPFGPRYRGGCSLAVGDLDGDDRLEIIVGAGSSVIPEVVVLRSDGTPIGKPFLVFGRNFRGGVRVAMGDLDGDGRAEIVVGAGRGGGPHVRIFDGVQRTLRHEFFAFDARRRGGVDVAIADLDGDGRGEILAMTTQAFTIAGVGGR